MDLASHNFRTTRLLLTGGRRRVCQLKVDGRGAVPAENNLPQHTLHCPAQRLHLLPLTCRCSRLTDATPGRSLHRSTGHSTARHGTARHGTARRGAARHGVRSGSTEPDPSALTLITRGEPPSTSALSGHRVTPPSTADRHRLTPGRALAAPVSARGGRHGEATRAAAAGAGAAAAAGAAGAAGHSTQSIVVRRHGPV